MNTDSDECEIIEKRNYLKLKLRNILHEKYGKDTLEYVRAGRINAL